MLSIRRTNGFLLCILWGGLTASAATYDISVIRNLLNSARPGDTVRFPPGTYATAPGASILITKPLTIEGNNATLVNFRLNFAANVTIKNLNMTESDCSFTVTSPNSCSPATPMLSIGYGNSVITQASLSNIRMNFGRAYTGIEFGQGTLSNLVIDGFDITANQMSGMTGLGGRNIRIANGTLRGGSASNVDDGIALYSVYGELSDVLVENIRSENNFDAVGIGALLYRPLHDIRVRNVTCSVTAVCIYLKAGDSATPPASAGGAYSTMYRVTVDQVTNIDLTGKRYLSTIWMYAKGGATVQDVTVSNVRTTARSATSTGSHVHMFTDAAASTIDNFRLQDANFINSPLPAGGIATIATGLATTTGAFIQTANANAISNLSFSGITLSGLTLSGYDSTTGTVRALSIDTTTFLGSPRIKQYRIPYAFRLNGSNVTARDQ